MVCIWSNPILWHGCWKVTILDQPKTSDCHWALLSHFIPTPTFTHSFPFTEPMCHVCCWQGLGLLSPHSQSSRGTAGPTRGRLMHRGHRHTGHTSATPGTGHLSSLEGFERRLHQDLPSTLPGTIPWCPAWAPRLLVGPWLSGSALSQQREETAAPSPA